MPSYISSINIGVVTSESATEKCSVTHSWSVVNPSRTQTHVMEIRSSPLRSFREYLRYWWCEIGKYLWNFLHAETKYSKGYPSNVNVQTSFVKVFLYQTLDFCTALKKVLNLAYVCGIVM